MKDVNEYRREWRKDAGSSKLGEYYSSFTKLWWAIKEPDSKAGFVDVVAKRDQKQNEGIHPPDWFL